MNNPSKKLSASLLVIITPPAETAKLDKIFQRAGFPIQYRFRGEGTASSDIMDLLGLMNRDKAVTLCILPKLAIGRTLKAVSDELGLYSAGHGIAFSVPLSGVSTKALQRFEEHFSAEHFSGEIARQLENEVSNMFESFEYCLVLAAVDQGYSEEVMESAKECGVTGGTVIHARRLGMEEKMKFWGISLQSEKDIIAIILPKAKKLELMQAIGENYGMQSKAHGMIFSMPVESIAGIGQQPVI